MCWYGIASVGDIAASADYLAECFAVSIWHVKPQFAKFERATSTWAVKIADRKGGSGVTSNVGFAQSDLDNHPRVIERSCFQNVQGNS